LCLSTMYLPKVVAIRVSKHQYCQLVIKMTVRRGKGGFIYLGHPLPSELPR